MLLVSWKGSNAGLQQNAFDPKKQVTLSDSIHTQMCERRRGTLIRNSGAGETNDWEPGGWLPEPGVGLREAGQGCFWSDRRVFCLIVVVFAFVKMFKMNVLTAYNMHLSKAYLRRKQSIKSKPK